MLIAWLKIIYIYDIIMFIETSSAHQVIDILIIQPI